MMQEYIITEDELLDIASYIYHEDEVPFFRVATKVRSRPYTAASGREQVLDELDVYAEACRSENEARGRQEKDEIIVSALAGAALAFEGMRAKIAELRKQGEQP